MAFTEETSTYNELAHRRERSRYARQYVAFVERPCRLPTMYTLLHLGVLALTILALSRILPGVNIKSFGSAVVVAVVFSVLNFFLGWLIRAVLFVPALLTLGLLFLFVPLIVNTALLWLTDKLMASFEIRTLKGLVISAAVITLVNGVFYAQSFRDAWYGNPDGSGHRTLDLGESHPRWI
jgi:putative membrane protein